MRAAALKIYYLKNYLPLAMELQCMYNSLLECVCTMTKCVSLQGQKSKQKN